MPKVTVLDMAGKEVSKIDLSDAVFGIEPNKAVMHDMVKNYLANQRQGTQSALTRAEVSGGGKKPWRQKGTGRARAGSSRSPIWVGGGTVFGPIGNQNFKLKMNKKSHALALKSALSIKANEKNIVLVENLTSTKTKEVVKTLEALKVDSKALVVLAEENEEFTRAARNVPFVKVVLANNVSVYDLINATKLVMTVDAAKAVEGGLK